MRYTQYQMTVKASVHMWPAIVRTTCDCCSDSIWLEWMWRVKTNYFCRSCAPDTNKAYELVFPKVITALDVMIRNARAQVQVANQKVAIAEQGLRNIILKANDPNAEWNPNRDEFVAGTLVEAENTLKQLQ